MKNKKYSKSVEGKKESKPFSEKKRKAIESTATFGLILVALGLAAPFTNLLNYEFVKIFKWIYSAGALIFVIARIVGATDPQDSIRIRRFRRMECWAGIALCIGAFFWFYNENHFSFYLDLGMGSLACLRDTIYFTLAGGIIQILAIFAISKRLKKEQSE